MDFQALRVSLILAAATSFCLLVLGVPLGYWLAFTRSRLRALVEPVVAEWVVGTLGVAYDTEADRIVLQADELVDQDDEDEEDAGLARFHLTRAQVVAFCEHADSLVAAGRPPCPICGQPMDPDGHVCPRSNGHK